MKTITLKCPVTVKSKVTDVLKEQLVAEIKEAMAKVDMELQQIEFHAKRLMTEQVRSDVQGLTALRQQIDGEKQKRLELKNHLQEKMKETSQLELGAEIVQGTMEQMVTVQEGDDLQKLMNREILLEDGKNLYGQMMRLEFVGRVRGEERSASVDAV